MVSGMASKVGRGRVQMSWTNVSGCSGEEVPSGMDALAAWPAIELPLVGVPTSVRHLL